jgi:phosphate transport system substrate-binding protein
LRLWTIIRQAKQKLGDTIAVKTSIIGRLACKTTLLCLAIAILPVRAQATDINGSGSTFVYPLMLTWAAHYHDKADVVVNYQGTGSGAGIRQIKAGMVTFGASDMPLKPEELQASGLAQFPVVIGGVVPVVNLAAIRPGELNFTGELLAAIYLGKITNWRDPAIMALNPGANLPDLKIVVTHRSDGSGTTFNWTNYLSKVSGEWKSKVGEGTTVHWPTGEEAKGNEGVAHYVNYVAGAIGYVELAFALDHKMVYSNLKNKSGVFVTPSLKSFQAAAVSADWKAPDFYEVLTDAPAKDAWPITATVFVLMHKQSADAAQSAATLQFFQWALEQGKSDAERLNYVPLPQPLVRQVEEYWARTIR